MTGSQLKTKRELMALTQSQLAEALGVDVGTVSRWERDARPIPPYLAGVKETSETLGLQDVELSPPGWVNARQQLKSHPNQFRLD